jgi:hypothetical protein
LKLRTLCRQKVLKLIDEYYPKVWPEYDWIYNQGGGEEYWSVLKKEIAAYCEQENLEYEIAFEADHKERKETENAAQNTDEPVC